MKTNKFPILGCTVLGAALSLCVIAMPHAILPAFAEQNGDISAGALTSAPNIIDEEPLPENPNERKARVERSRYFNGGQADLTRSGNQFIEHYALSVLPPIPFKESGIIFVGTILKLQPYLSEDRTHIYTEMVFRVEDLFEYSSSFARSPDGRLVIDRIGGNMRLRSGQLIRDYTDLDIGGSPYVGGRYVVFAKERPKHGPLDIVRAYELRNGQVFKLGQDGKPGKVLFTTRPGAKDPLSDEQTFLQAVVARSLQ